MDILLVACASLVPSFMAFVCCILLVNHYFPTFSPIQKNSRLIGRQTVPWAWITHLVLLGLFHGPVKTLTTAWPYSRSSPLRIPCLLTSVYLIQGADNVKTILDNRSLSAYFLHDRALSIFGLSKGGVAAYKRDQSGPGITPRRGTEIQSKDRLEYQSNAWYHQFLISAGLKPLLERYHTSFVWRLRYINQRKIHQRQEGNDFMQFCKDSLIGPAIIDAIMGPQLLQRHPDFLVHFMAVHDNFWWLASGFPRWLMPNVNHSLRECLEVLKAWHAWARENSDPFAAPTSAGDNDPYWGTRWHRQRQLWLSRVEGMTKNDLASHDFAFLWAAAHNTVPAMFWLVVDVCRHPDILQHIRAEADTCLLRCGDGGLPIFDIERLMTMPYLQAAFAENLRLRTHGTIPRRPEQDLTVDEWVIPAKSFVAIPSTMAHLDTSVWSHKDRGSHSVQNFAPARFFTYSDTNETLFLKLGTDRSWIPFGAGVRACPGRHFVKQEMILTLATMVTMYDIEIKACKEQLKMRPGRFGLGVLESGEKIPFSMTLRTWQEPRP